MYNNSKNKKINLKVTIIGILIGAILLSYNSYGIALADPAHCDRAGFPSCYDVGFGDGQANPGTSCPGGHSAQFCQGWNAGANSGSNSGFQNQQQSPSPTNQQGTTIEDLCNQYHNQLGLNQPCSNYVQGNNLQGPGTFFIVCNILKLGVHVTGPLAFIVAAVPCG